MIYFDNAATGGFKPHSALSAAETTMKFLSANPGRSAHRLSNAGAEIVFNCRKVLGEGFGASPDRCIFTKNCTEALNYAIFGSVKKGGHVITTVYEHNSVLRPLFYLKNNNVISLDVVAPTVEKDLVSKIEETINENTYMLICTAVSNVTGEKLPYKELGKLAKKHNLLFLVDGAQAGGHIDINIKNDNVSFLALAGHKGLFATMGNGALLIDDKCYLSPLIMGGTGSESFNLNQPENYPEKLESGTLNLPGIASFAEGARYALDNLKSFSDTLYGYTLKLIVGLSTIDKAKLYSTPNPSGIVSFSLDGFSSGEVADILNSEYDVAVRAGLHCAPLLHKFLNTEENGLVRASLSVQNSLSEIAYFINCIKKIAKN